MLQGIISIATSGLSGSNAYSAGNSKPLIFDYYDIDTVGGIFEKQCHSVLLAT